MKQEIFKFQDEKQVRAVYTNDGTLMYCLSDIAYCLGNKSPTAFASKNNIGGVKMYVKWHSGSKSGKSLVHVSSYENLMILADKYKWSDSLVLWIKEIERVHQSNRKQPIESSNIDFDTLNKMMDNVVYACLDLRKKITAYSEMNKAT